MKIDRIVLRNMLMPLKEPFETSFGTIYDRSFMVVEVHSSDLIGYAEVVTEKQPRYSEECIGTAWYILETFLVPLLFKSSANITHPAQISRVLEPVKRHYIAKSALENACWDLFAKQQGESLSTILGGTREEIEVGIAIGIQNSIPELVERVGQCVDEGYKRIKVKIKPGWDVSVIDAIRSKYPDIALMADANSAYTLDQIDILKQLDRYNLTMIEQPLSHDDIIDHSVLQKQMKTPICLDESIHSVEDVRKALYLGSCEVINIKIGRVGGLSEALKIHDYCMKENIPVWCGGMLEAGIGRAHNIAIASLKNFTIPGDTSPSKRYWEEDLLEEDIEFSSPGIINVPSSPGIGVEVNVQKLNRFTTESKTFHNYS